MTDRRIKNEQWSVRELLNKIHNKEINKPKFQRKRKWDIQPTKDNTPNEKSYIEFLYATENSVHAITFGQETNNNKICLSNIDGNNRINALKHFIDTPFEIFIEYLKELNDLINGLTLDQEDKNIFKNIFKKLSYNQIMNFKYHKYFNDSGYESLYNKIQIYRDNFEEPIENVQKKLKLKNSENFDSNVKINVNIFEGYTTDELCIIFEDINKFNSPLTETELLACKLFNENNFHINDNIFKTELEECIKEYYNNKADGEVLNCYIYDSIHDKINGHDYIVGLQNLCNKKYENINIKTDTEGSTLFCKLFKVLYTSYNNTFTSENINNFKEIMMVSCDILNQTINNIFNDKINPNLFNSTCSDKINTLKKNNLYVLLSCIIGYKQINKPIDIIKQNIERCLLYHFFTSDIKDKIIKEEFRTKDILTYKAGGAFIDTLAKNLLDDPERIHNKITIKSFKDIISYLFFEINSPYERKLDTGKNRNDKRRQLKFYEKTLMFYFYKGKIPINMLENKFSIEHICPNSSDWDGELDKDRTGNLIPIIDGMNSSRGNRHINEYYNTSNGISFCDFIKDIIPKHTEYDRIVTHVKKPKIINNELYNNMCSKNEEIYKQHFIKCLFK